VKENEFNFKSRLPKRASRLTLLRLVIYAIISVGLLIYVYRYYF